MPNQKLDDDWEIGDVVRLKSGGPPMTVEAIIDTVVGCVWNVDGTIHRGAFMRVLLVKVTEPI